MKIALVGYGKMGHEVERVALDRGHQIVARCDPMLPGTSGAGLTREVLNDAQVCVEFTQPASALKNIREIAALRKPLVVGTTGWYQHLPEVRGIVERAAIGLVYAPNFSLGVNLFYQIAAKAAELFNCFEEYDVCVSEAHHRHKVDSPSGTARKLSEIVLQKFTRKKRVVTESLNRPIAPEELHVVSIRSGHFPGVHSLTFDSASDTVELIHTVRSRGGFAVGALLAAEWIVNRQGLYTFEQLLGETLKIKSE